MSKWILNEVKKVYKKVSTDGDYAVESVRLHEIENELNKLEEQKKEIHFKQNKLEIELLKIKETLQGGLTGRAKSILDSLSKDYFEVTVWQQDYYDVYYDTLHNFKRILEGYSYDEKILKRHIKLLSGCYKTTWDRYKMTEEDYNSIHDMSGYHTYKTHLVDKEKQQKVKKLIITYIENIEKNSRVA